VQAAVSAGLVATFFLRIPECVMTARQPRLSGVSLMTP
jgi:hypothetical protein